ncbi:response regulator [Eisenbergiella sp.]
MKKGWAGGSKIKIALAAVVVVTVLSVMTWLFVYGVKNQLWEQSVSTIIESTMQGRDTLRIQLEEEYGSLETFAGYVKEHSSRQEKELQLAMESYVMVDRGAVLYLSDGRFFPAEAGRDEEARGQLEKTDKEKGIINPHISSVTGMNVFNLFVRITMQDGTTGFLVKEYEVENIVDSFSLSFYNDAGFSYVINTAGDVLIRPPHPNSNKTVQNLFDMLPVSKNSEKEIRSLATALEESRTGWAVFTYQEEQMVFCYTPLKLQSDWYLMSIIPRRVVEKQTNEILLRALGLIASIILGIFLLAAFYFRYANRTNRQLGNQAEYIGHLYNAVPEGIALITQEQPLHFLQLNREGLRLLEYPEDAQNDAPRGKALQDVIHPEDYGQTMCIFRDTVENDRKNIFENRVVRQDGTWFWASGIVEKMKDTNGNPVLIATFHDITEEKLAKEAAERAKLQERLTLVGAISNAYPVIISMNLTRDTLNFIYVKPGLMLELGKQKAYTELFEDMLPTVHPDAQDKFKSRFSPESLQNTLGQEKNEIFMEAQQRMADGEYHWTSTQVIYVDNPYSEDKLAILISRRNDEQRYEEEQRRQALQSALDSARAASSAKSRFLSNMSHDIRTPMNAIVGMTAIATAHLEDRERVVECLRKISLSSQHLLSLINDVLDMSKIESGKLSLREEPFNFAELVSDAVELVRPQANAGGLNLEIQLSLLKNEKVIADPLRIRQVCINILSNAVKYTPEGGSVLVEVRQESSVRRGYENYIIRCEDTGVGMSEEFMKKLFQPFERAQDSTSSKIVGTGLGMAITKNIVEMMSGDIFVESCPQRGSVFTVIIPMKPENAQQEEVPGEWIGVHSLIVDDDRQTCENAAELLDNMGLRAEFVTEGRAAVSLVVQSRDTADPFQLVIIDWKMPDMDGVEAARQIRSEVGPDIPVIILTAYDWAEIEGEAREAGVTAFLAKPFYRSKICYLLSELSEEKDSAEPVRPGWKADYTGKRVLLAEDNEINREIARELVGESGVTIEEACDGKEAVRMVQEAKEGYYDLILMDIQMPKMDGYEAARAIRKLERRDVKLLPIVAMTANAFAEDVQAAYRSGMNSHLAKPIDLNELGRILRLYLSGDGSGEERPEAEK